MSAFDTSFLQNKTYLNNKVIKFTFTRISHTQSNDDVKFFIFYLYHVVQLLHKNYWFTLRLMKLNGTMKRDFFSMLSRHA